MTSNTLRHLTALCATLICGLAYLAGYFSGPSGWWWTIFSLFIVYGGIYRVLSHH